ncbi:MAG: glycosyltransferase [Candidatus Odinarchaeota archaeon]|nr:glycosyltransferase [Candidatus Odinarchaeota archaeon]
MLDLISMIISYCLALYLPFLALLSILYKKPEKAEKRAENVEFVIVTIGTESVRDALFETLDRVTNMFAEYKIYVLTEEYASLIPEIKRYPVDVVIVPRSYTCKAKYKARALNYFVETRVKENMWYVFLDDDSYPLDDNFLYELPIFEKKGYVAGNGILIPRRGRSKLTYLADFLRTATDLLFLRFTLGVLRRPWLFGLHGELLIVKGWVLKEIGFNFDSIAEDSRFAAEIFRKKYRTFQTTTEVSILSPNSVSAFWRQRARWIRGILHDVKEYPSPLREITLITMILWFPSIFGYTFLILDTINILYSIALYIQSLATITVLYHNVNSILAFFYSLIINSSVKQSAMIPLSFIIRNITPARLWLIFLILTYFIGGRGKDKILVVVCLYIVALIEFLAPLYALLFYKGGFVVINKNIMERRIALCELNFEPEYLDLFATYNYNVKKSLL